MKSRFGAYVLDPAEIMANESLAKVIKLFFIVLMFFISIPFAAYLTYRSSGPVTNEISFMRLFQVYAYSMAVFIPMTIAYTACS